MKMKAMMASGLAAASLLLAAGLASAPASAEDVTLKMAVPDWPPTHIMKDLFDKTYKPKSGNKVTLDVDFIPWPDYYTRLNASLTSGEKKYNMAVSDSQWLGAFIEGGYYLNINKYVDADPDLQAVFKDLHPAVKDCLFDLSLQVGQAVRLPADAGPRHQLLPQGRLLRPDRAEEFHGQIQVQAALHARGDGPDHLGQLSRLRRVLQAQEGRDADGQAAR